MPIPLTTKSMAVRIKSFASRDTKPLPETASSIMSSDLTPESCLMTAWTKDGSDAANAMAAKPAKDIAVDQIILMMTRGRLRSGKRKGVFV